MAQEQQTATRTDGRKHEHRTAKVVELVGASTEDFSQAVENALMDARETTRGITGAEVQSLSVNCEDGEIVEYKADVKIAFGIERTSEA